MRRDFYRAARHLDVLKTQETFTSNEIRSLLVDLRSTPFFRYFFSNLKNEHLLTWQAFQTFLAKSFSGQEYARQHYVAEYLKQVVTQRPEEVFQVLRRSNPDNPNLSGVLLECIVEMDTPHAAKLVQFVMRHLVHVRASDGEMLGRLLSKYSEGRFKAEATMLFGYLTEPVARKLDRAVTKEFPSIGRKEAEGRLEQYELNEIIEVGLPKLLEAFPDEVVRILERNLTLALEIESANNKAKRKEDFSYIWRPAIEEHEQNYDFGKLKENLVSLLRDSLRRLSKEEQGDRFHPVLKRYLRAQYTIFKRLALYIMSENPKPFIELIEQFILRKKNLDDHRIKHELFGLIRNAFPLFNPGTKAYLTAWIEAGPSTDWWIKWRTKEESKPPTSESVQDFVDHWKLERYWVIRDYVPEKADIIRQLESHFGTPKHPDFPSWREDTVFGFDSPLTVDDLKTKDADDLIAILKNPPTTKEHDPVFPHEGLAITFETIVKEKAQEYLPFAAKIARNGILPAFIKSYFRALRESWLSQELQWTDDLHELATLVAVESPNPHGWNQNDRSGMRMDLSRLIEAIVSTRGIEVTADNLARFKLLLLSMMGDPDPSADEELENYQSNRDWPFVALNRTAGQVLHGLIRYALCYARFHPEPSERLEADVRTALETTLRTDKRLSVASVFGTYIANLWYLDATWMKSNLRLIFPKGDSRKSDAVWDAYLKFNNVYKEVYVSLIDEYKRAIRKIATKNSISSWDDRQLAQHIAITYWQGWDDIEGRTSLVTQFFNVAPPQGRVDFIRHIEMGLRELQEGKDLSKQADAWKRPRELWEWRVRRYKRPTDTQRHEDEMSAFLRWLPHVPEDVSILEGLISRTIRKRRLDSPTGSLTEYLKEQSTKFPLECVRLLDRLFESPWDKGYSILDVSDAEAILEAALEAGDKPRQMAARVASKLGEYGYFQFKPIWDKANEPVSSSRTVMSTGDVVKALK